MNVFVISCDIAGHTSYFPTGSVLYRKMEMMTDQLNMSFLKICSSFDSIRYEYLAELNDNYEFFNHEKSSDGRKVKQASLESKYRNLISSVIDDVIDRNQIYCSAYKNQLTNLRGMSAANVLTIGYHSLPRNFKLISRDVTEEILGCQ